MENKRNVFTLFGKIINLERLNNTVNGNPRREIVLTTDTQGSFKLKTKGDSCFAGKICSSRLDRNVGFEITETPTRQTITDIELVN